jgi:hypothetical protein
MKRPLTARPSLFTVDWLRSASLLIVLLAIAGRALGQASPTATGPGTYLNVGVMGSLYKVNYGQATPGGVSIYADFNPTWRYGAELRAQSLRYHEQFGRKTDTLLVGPRFSIRDRTLVPYARALVGIGRYTFPYGYGTDTSFVVAPGAGVDWRVNERISVRLIDAEYQMWPQFAFGSMHPYGVSAGVSIQLWQPYQRPGWHRR